MVSVMYVLRCDGCQRQCYFVGCDQQGPESSNGVSDVCIALGTSVNVGAALLVFGSVQVFGVR
jgi:hypothetical protein